MTETISWGGRHVGKTHEQALMIWTEADKAFSKGARSFTFRSIGTKPPDYLIDKVKVMFEGVKTDVIVMVDGPYKQMCFPMYDITITKVEE
jgi:hypothetical protein